MLITADSLRTHNQRWLPFLNNFYNEYNVLILRDIIRIVKLHRKLAKWYVILDSLVLLSAKNQESLWIITSFASVCETKYKKRMYFLLVLAVSYTIITETIQYYFTVSF
jgi:hypothetical protein